MSSPEDESHDKLGYSEQADQYSLGIAVASLSIIDGLKSVTWSKIQNATLSDPDMLQLLNLIQDGFPEEISLLPENLRQYHKYRNHLSNIDAVVLFKERVVVPPALRVEVL